MRVRVYDKDSNNYFISEVYGIINTGYYEKYLVIKYQKGVKVLLLIDYLNKESKEVILPVNINIISANILTEDWIRKSEEDLVSLHHSDIDRDKDIYSFRGYSFIYKNKEIIEKLMAGKKIPIETIKDFREICTDLNGWKYVYSQEDIEHLMKEFSGFHDSVLVSANYISGAGKSSDGMYICDHVRQVEIRFDSEWAKSITIVFEGVLSFNLYPAKDNYSSELFEATILREDETIYFYTADVTDIDESYDETWINSLGMRWKFIDSE